MRFSGEEAGEIGRDRFPRALGAALRSLNSMHCSQLSMYFGDGRGGKVTLYSVGRDTGIPKERHWVFIEACLLKPLYFHL